MNNAELTRSREWLLLNAVEAWLHHYANSGAPTVAQYKQLQAEFHDAYMQSLSKDAVERSETPAEPKPTPQRRTTRAKTKDA